MDTKAPVSDAQLREVEQRLTTAYTYLVCNQPFLASLLLRLQRSVDYRHPRMWVDGVSLGYNPHYILTLTEDELVGTLAHCVYHVASMHPWRQGLRDTKTWEESCDKVVNQLVKENDLKLPKGTLPGVPNKSAEELYTTQQMREPGNASNEPGQGSADVEPGQGSDVGSTQPPQHPDGREMTEQELENSANEAKVTIQQALNAAKMQGKLPAGLERLVQEILEPKVPWREILARFVDSFSNHDYSWSRPNRRYMQQGVILPSLYVPGFGQIAMACDTSGSISGDELKEICSEVLGCLDVYAERGQPTELLVMWCDTKVSAQVVTDASELRPVGGGGTSFAPVFKYMQDTGAEPKAVIYVTDGYCNDFGKEPPCPTLWVLTRTNKGFKPPFGEIACTLNK